MRALVIDDSKAMRSIIGKVLRDLGFEVTEAGDGRAALETIRTVSGIELALVDWNLPVMDGLEFVQAVRQDPAFSHVRLIKHSQEEPPRITALRSDVPARILTAIQRMMAKRPSERFPTPRNVAEALV